MAEMLDLAVRFRAAISPGLTVKLLEEPTMRYDCLRFTYPADTFRTVLAAALAALARRGLETVPPSKGPTCPVIAYDPLAITIGDMIGADGIRRIKQMREALRVHEQAKKAGVNAAGAVVKALHVSESTAYRLLRQAGELGLAPAGP
jgi:hypothetical protein